MKPIFTCCFLFLFGLSNAQTAATASSNTAVPIHNNTQIKWMTIEQAEAAQKVKPKKILVSVYATWCRWCRLEDSLTFRNTEIANYINDNFYPVRFNAETREAVNYKGVKYIFNNDQSKWVHGFATYLLNGKMSYPGIAYLDEKGNLISASNGYMDAYYLEAVLNYYGTNAYKGMTYRDFEADFEGKIE